MALNAEALLQMSDTLVVLAIRSVLSARGGSSTLVALAGSQGSGKSTTAQRIAKRLEADGCGTVVCSLDDFYLTRMERMSLAARVHPLLATRGVPGTHDVALLHETLASLASAGPASSTALPSFDKIADDRRPRGEWPVYRGQASIILIEGWCMGARPQAESALLEPINALERDGDGDGTWRRHVNRQLAGDYARLFAMFHLRILLRAPDFSIVHAWRDEQEEKLAQMEGKGRSMTAQQIGRFIAHYERLTRWIIDDQPADLIVDLDAERTPIGWRVSSPRD